MARNILILGTSYKGLSEDHAVIVWTPCDG
jgi:hypothetical protein